MRTPWAPSSRAQYAAAGVSPDEIDTGALILTGVAVRRSNARAIGEIFSAQTGKFVVVSAGDGLETTLAAFGSGAVARSGRDSQRVLNVDIGGGTSKLALCENGAIRNVSAIDIGARVIAFDADRRITRIEQAGQYFGDKAGVRVELGATLSAEDAKIIADTMVDHLFEAMQGGTMRPETVKLHRLQPLPEGPAPDVVTISGGVSEFLYAKRRRSSAIWVRFSPQACASSSPIGHHGWNVPNRAFAPPLSAPRNIPCRSAAAPFSSIPSTRCRSATSR